MKKFKKIIPPFLYAFMMVAIAVLCVIITEHSDLSDFFASGANEKTTVYESSENNTPNVVENISEEKTANGYTDDTSQKSIDTAAKNEKEEHNEEINDITPEENSYKDEQTSNPQYNDTIPRGFNESEQYLFTQKIYGDGTVELCDVFQTSVGYFAFVKSDCTAGDIDYNGKTVGIVKLDSYGNILKSFSFPGDNYYNFICAEPTVLGFVSVFESKDSKNYYVTIVDYELENFKTNKLNAGLNCRISPTKNSFLLFIEYSNESLVYSYSENGFSFRSVCYGNICEIFEFGNYYLLFINDKEENDYTILKVDKKNLNVISETIRTGSVIKNVFPATNNGKQVIIILENRNNSLWVQKYENDNFSSPVDCKKIGNFELKSACYDGNDILLICKGNVSGIIRLSTDLNTMLVENKSFSPDKILDKLYINDSFYMLVINDDSELALWTFKNEVFTAEYYNVKTDKGFIFLTLDNNLILCHNEETYVRFLGSELK